MKRLILITALAAMTVGFAACQPKSKKKTNAVATSFNDLSGIYKLKVNNSTTSRDCQTCNVADWSSNDKNEFCSRLSNHALNGYCGEAERQTAFLNAQCPGNFVTDDPSLKVCSGSGHGKFEHFQLPNVTGTATDQLSNSDIQLYNTEIRPYHVATYPAGFEGFGCRTGMERSWRYNNIADFCQNIQDDTLNAGCAHGVRRKIHTLYCSRNGAYTTTNPYYSFDLNKFASPQTQYQLDIVAGIKGLFDGSVSDGLKTHEIDCTGVKIATDNKDVFCAKLRDTEFETKCFKPIIDSQKSSLNTRSSFEDMLKNVEAEVGCL